MATQRRAGLNHLSQCLRYWLPVRDNKPPGPGDKPFAWLQRLRSTRHDLRGEPLHISIITAHDIPSEGIRQPGQMTTSSEDPKVENPNPMLHLMQHHLTLLHASSCGNDCIGSSDLLDSGDWVPRSLQVHHQWCAGGQRGAHPWDHNDGPRGLFTKSVTSNPQSPQPKHPN